MQQKFPIAHYFTLASCLVHKVNDTKPPSISAYSLGTNASETWLKLEHFSSLPEKDWKIAKINGSSKH